MGVSEGDASPESVSTVGTAQGKLDVAGRTRLASAALALAFFSTLPVPTPREPGAWNAVVLTLWLGLGFLSWACWYRPDWTRLIWFVCLAVSVVGIFIAGTLLQTFLLVCWAFWKGQRERRELRSLSPKMGIALALSLFATSPASAASKPTVPSKANPESTIPKYLVGYKLSEIGSCARIDLIPWRFRPEGRKTRLIIRDRLHQTTETQFRNWEIHQVMNRDGYVTYIFRHQLADGRYDSIVTKDAAYNRILDTPKGPKIVEVQNLKNFINRPVLSFITEDGTQVSFEPGLAGSSALSIQFGGEAEGRVLPPIYLRGTYCTRPEGEDDNKGDQSNQLAPAQLAKPGAK